MQAATATPAFDLYACTFSLSCHQTRARATDQHITFNTDYLSDTLVDFFRCCMCCLDAMMFCRYNWIMIRSVSRSWGRILNTIPNEHDYYVYSALMAPGGNQVRVVLNHFFFESRIPPRCAGLSVTRASANINHGFTDHPRHASVLHRSCHTLGR